MAEGTALTAQELYTVAKNQRWLIYVVLVMIITNIAYFAVQSPADTPMTGGEALVALFISLVQLVAVVVSMVAIWKVLRTTGTGVFPAVVALIVVVIPIVGIVVLLLVSTRATRALREAGFTVGLLGAKADTIRQLRAASASASATAAPPPLSGSE